MSTWPSGPLRHRVPCCTRLAAMVAPVPSGSRPSLRERNHERTRDEIAGHALDLFVARGFDAVTVDDIAASAGISRRTFFRYFETKEDALLPADASRLQRLEQALRERPPAEGDRKSTRGALLELAHDYENGSTEVQIGRASCRERVCQDVSSTVGA